MKLTDQVCSLELARRLKELGISQESLWWYSVDVAGPVRINLQPRDDIERRCRLDSEEQWPGLYKNYAAFTVAELGEMLRAEEYDAPEYMYHESRWRWTEWLGMPGHVRYHYIDEQPDTTVTEADARAKMLIYLIENGLIKLTI